MKTTPIVMLACSGLVLWAACSSDSASDADAAAAGEGVLDDAGAAGSGGRLGSGGAGGAAGVSSQDGGVGGDGGGAGASGSGGQGGSAGVAGSSGGGSGGSAIGPACPGVEPRADTPGETCRSLEDCTAGGFCSEELLSGCGACMLPQRECETHGDCAGGNRCVNGPIAPCSCTGTPSSSCVPACTTDSCPDGERCSDGVCEPTPCDEGFDCGDGHVCAAERRTADVHGCAPFNCNEGYVCEPGFECDAPSGDCLAVHCREGGDAVCPTNRVCDDGVAGRGCVAKPCRADGDCDCGACIQRCSGAGCPPGECHDRLWVCGSLPP